MSITAKKYIPEKSGFWKQDYVTYRRLWLDSCLNAFSNEMRGTVLDLGGKRENKRGAFQPPEKLARSWQYINLDWETHPNIFADVTRTPFQAESVDCILCTEVLEHLPDPQACVDEIHRLLHNNGVALVSVPFFYPVHADPYDFQRFTEDGLRHLFREFKSIEVYRMGGYAGVLGLLCELGIPGVHGNSIALKLLRWIMKWFSRWLCWYDLLVFSKKNLIWEKYTTGYFLKAVR
ncbi:MAG: class I SAM-dependent methyltransferase [Anaerolineales bacterium]|nr:class I SAM-dependent methyltransferase [Anaerolineales bacterium]